MTDVDNETHARRDLQPAPNNQTALIEPTREIVEILKRERIHPVLVFGTRASGKTLLLQSLFHYVRANDDSRLALHRGQTIWPPKHSGYPEVEESGRQLLDSDLTALDGGTLPVATSRPLPFLIPADIVHEGETTRLAFLEGMGEWFERQKTPEGKDDPRLTATLPFVAFKGILTQILRTFEDGVSMLFLAPCIDSPQGLPKEYAHECLSSAMREVVEQRAYKERDRLLLLATKWDGVCSPASVDSRFSDASADILLKRVAEWRFAWPQYVSMHGFPAHARAAMPYSAGWIEDGKIVRSPRHRPIFNRFNRTASNWLYANAKTAFADPPPGPRPVLYEDVVPEASATMGSWERLTRFVTTGRIP